VTFDTFKGVSLLIHAQLGDNNYPAIGAGVFNEDGRNSGTVGLNGDTYVSGVKPGEKLTIKWGPKADQQCVLPIPASVGNQQTGMGYQELTLQCQKL
jgi:outer membrane usher protein